MTKAAIIVLADTESHADLGRVVNALVATKEFKESGDDVQLIFDGAGTKWPGVLADPGHRAHKVYAAVEDVVTGACGYCAKAFHTVDGVEDAHVQLLNEYEGHPS
ncbi:MAG: hypothetical protein ACRDQ7_15725, partial [Haloechinothrix sp.]